MRLLLLSLDTMPSALSHHPRQLNESFREAQINPSIVVIIIILTIIFFLSGCLHLLIRCLVMRSPRRDPNSIVTLTALQGQLQQLFHLHDSGVEQAFIDTLPVFFYKSVKGLKEGADCAVCLCEFEAEDRLRLLPKCSHAFHMDCIDTWLLSHSTCPLCRRSLLPDDFGIASVHHGLLLDSSRSSIDTEVVQRTGSDTGLEIVSTAESGERPQGAVSPDANKPHSEISVDGGASVSFPEEHPQSQYAGKVLTVQLGRFKVVEGGTHTGVSSSINGSRRSYSVGSYEYVLDPSNLEVVIAPTPLRKRTSTPRRPTPGHRATLSECTPEDVLPDPILTPFDEGFFPSRNMRAINSSWVTIDLTPSPGAATGGESNPDGGSCSSKQTSRRAFSFRQPVNHDAVKLKVSASRRSLSEAEILGGWSDQDQCSFSGAHLVSASTELSNIVPAGGHTQASLRGAAVAPYSLAKRTFNWLVGRQH
eukprot:c20501_g1_i1 orf=58-1488(+)